MSWLKIGLLLLQVANKIFDSVRRQQDFNAGRDAEIAKQSMAILAKTAQGKQIMEKLNSMSDAEVDDITKQLGEP